MSSCSNQGNVRLPRQLEAPPTVVWIINDENDLRRNPIEQLCFNTTCHVLHLHSYIPLQKAKETITRLNDDGPALVWMQLNRCSMQDNKERHKLLMMSSIAAQQLHRKGWLFIEANPKMVRDFICNEIGQENFRTVTIPLCNLGIKHPQHKRPISSRVFGITNIPLSPTINMCSCSVPLTDHVKAKLDLHHRDTHRDFSLVQGAAYQMLSATLIASAGSPDTGMGVPEFRPQDRYSSLQDTKHNHPINLATLRPTDEATATDIHTQLTHPSLSRHHGNQTPQRHDR